MYFLVKWSISRFFQCYFLSSCFGFCFIAHALPLILFPLLSTVHCFSCFAFHSFTLLCSVWLVLFTYLFLLSSKIINNSPSSPFFCPFRSFLLASLLLSCLVSAWAYFSILFPFLSLLPHFFSLASSLCFDPFLVFVSSSFLLILSSIFWFVCPSFSVIFSLSFCSWLAKLGVSSQWINHRDQAGTAEAAEFNTTHQIEVCHFVWFLLSHILLSLPFSRLSFFPFLLFLISPFSSFFPFSVFVFRSFAILVSLTISWSFYSLDSIFCLGDLTSADLFRSQAQEVHSRLAAFQEEDRTIQSRIHIMESRHQKLKFWLILFSLSIILYLSSPQHWGGKRRGAEDEELSLSSSHSCSHPGIVVPLKAHLQGNESSSPSHTNTKCNVIPEEEFKDNIDSQRKEGINNTQYTGQREMEIK